MDPFKARIEVSIAIAARQWRDALIGLEFLIDWIARGGFREGLDPLDIKGPIPANLKEALDEYNRRVKAPKTPTRRK